MKRGFSVIEVLVTLMITLIVLPATMSFLVQSYRSYFAVSSHSSVLETTRRIVDSLTHSLRQATTGDNGAYAIVDASAQSVTFYANVDAVADIERVRYFLQGTEIRRGIIKPTGSPATYPPANETVSVVGTMITNGAQAVFTYFDNTFTGSQSALTAPVNPNLVRFVHIRLVADDNTLRLPPAVTVESGTHLRNLKDNY